MKVNIHDQRRTVCCKQMITTSLPLKYFNLIKLTHFWQRFKSQRVIEDLSSLAVFLSFDVSGGRGGYPYRMMAENGTLMCFLSCYLFKYKILGKLNSFGDSGMVAWLEYNRNDSTISPPTKP